MGHARWDHSDWDKYKAKTSGRRSDELFDRKMIRKDFDPRNITVRESRDSEKNPQSNAIIVAFDETGSMGRIPDAFVREGLGKMVNELLERAPIQDPQVMIMGVGDAWADIAPLQVTQFEADIRIAEQLIDIYLEGNGGMNEQESYNLPWYFAARRTTIDCWEKRMKKGYLFTVGDEMPPRVLEAEHVKKFLGDDAKQDMKSEDVLAMASRTYNVFHIVVEEGHYCRMNNAKVKAAWQELLGQRTLMLSDYHKLAETVVSAIQITEGADTDTVTKSWSGGTDLVIAKAVGDMKAAGSMEEVIRF